MAYQYVAGIEAILHFSSQKVIKSDEKIKDWQLIGVTTTKPINRQLHV